MRRWLRSRGLLRTSPGEKDRLSLDAALSRFRARDIPIATVIDVGASDGRWSLSVKKHFPDARSPCAAICARCVMHSTWQCRPSRCSLAPTTSATAPPMPASTSSNTSVLPGTSVEASVLRASVRRDSSPPETIFASGRSSSPGLGDR